MDTDTISLDTDTILLSLFVCLLDMALDSTAGMDIDTISLDSNSTDDLSLPGSSESDAEGSSPGKPVLNNFVPLQFFLVDPGY